MAHVVDDSRVLSVAHGVSFERNARGDVAARELWAVIDFGDGGGFSHAEGFKKFCHRGRAARVKIGRAQDRNGERRLGVGTPDIGARHGEGLEFHGFLVGEDRRGFGCRSLGESLSGEHA